MLRITEVAHSAEEVDLKVEGWICGTDVVLLEQEGRRYLGAGEGLVLDLDGVQNIDESGVALLRCWSGKGVRLRGGSMFVQTLLASYGLGLQEQSG